MAEALKTFSFPVGGIADFYLEDHEKEALYKEKAQENFGSDGLGAIQDVAVRMASYGRYGDDKLVHAETGELVVPKALIDKNPKLKDSIFNHLKDMGIEDPERYVVGTNSNSINPETGLPEFFLKDIFDKVGDVIRKVAKPVLTIAGAAFGPYGAALGAGIGGLIQGESAEQALFSGLTAGAGSALFSGFAPGEGTFLGKIGTSLTTNPLDYAKTVTAPLLGQGGKDLPFIGKTAEATAGGFFDAPEMEEMEDIETGQDLLDKNRGKYIVQGTDIVGAQPPFMVPTRFPFSPSPPVQYAAEGGEAFPRRNGGIGMDEGTAGKDSVRAMLMPGEFVMTTDAVNGAGGGNNEKGIQNMYAMMRNFEAKARA
jgi:hypothetical protein